MPELPEVETYRRYAEASSMHQTIADFTCEDPRKLLLNPYDEMLEILRGSHFSETYRVGKHLFIRISETHWVYMHFGMTGDLHYFHQDDEPPRHARMVFYFTNGFRLGFLCPRKFERIGIVENPDAFLKKKGIAPDVMMIDKNLFFNNLSRKKSAIKSVLLDQSVVAGIGNWLADDVLFKAKIHPETPSVFLTENDKNRIFDAMQNIVQTTIDAEANYNLLPDDFILHARGWGKPHLSGKCPCGKETITMIRVGGRATYFCENLQVLKF
ncbi:MAG: DNA-formamidopyrimidine glycosylase family protein [Saprospiraceae bacterium]|nr:DNA-formamidopyrimidine glycosylase family protein [Saprospiraceae bacterium]